MKSRTIRISADVYEMLSRQRAELTAESGSFKGFGDTIKDLLLQVRKGKDRDIVRRAFDEAFGARPGSIGEVYAFADLRGICESTAHAFYELNERKDWQGIKNWKGALVAFSKVDKP